MRLMGSIGLVAIVLTLTAHPAAALTTSQFQGFSASIVDGMSVTPFDPSLGTLDRVDVSILGTLIVVGTTSQNFIFTPGPVPVPYLYEVDVTQQFVGLGGRYFDLNSGTFVFQGLATGAGEPFNFTTQYSYDFSFTAALDLVGFTLASTSSTVGQLIPPLGGIIGTRSDFVDNGIPLNEIDLFQQATFSAPFFIDVASFETSGIMEIDYKYTPASMPEPATLVLCAVGLVVVGVGAVRARRSRLPHASR